MLNPMSIFAGMAHREKPRRDETEFDVLYFFSWFCASNATNQYNVVRFKFVLQTVFLDLLLKWTASKSAKIWSIDWLLSYKIHGRNAVVGRHLQCSFFIVFLGSQKLFVGNYCSRYVALQIQNNRAFRTVLSISKRDHSVPWNPLKCHGWICSHRLNFNSVL